MQVTAKHLQNVQHPGNKLPASLQRLEKCATPILDPVIFGCLRDLLPIEVLAQTYREFLRQTREKLWSFSPMLGSESIHNLGHTIRGTAGMLGASQVALYAAELERESATDESLAQAIKHIHEGCNTLENALRKEQVR